MIRVQVRQQMHVMVAHARAIARHPCGAPHTDARQVRTRIGTSSSRRHARTVVAAWGEPRRAGPCGKLAVARTERANAHEARSRIGG